MDFYFCVVDASTLVENIQEIKSLIYQGRLRLVVPQCTSASLDQIYAKLKEDANKKPVRQSEPQRPRAGGKPTRTEPPAFDLNPLVAGELLNRIRSENGENSVEFQKDSEQYSPWKFLEQEEERSNTTVTKPSTFAQAVQKQNIERLLNSSGSANGPGKARLVAKAPGLDGSPWKTNTKALSLPISEVPKETRPLAVVDDNRETHGALEEDFGLADAVKAPPQDHSRKDQKEVSASISLQELSMDQVDGKSAQAPIKDSVTGSSSSIEHTASASSAKSSGSDKENVAPEKSKSQSNSKSSENLNGLEQSSEEVSKALPEEHHNEIDLRQTSCTMNKATPAEEVVEENRAEAHGKASVFNTLDVEKENSIAAWVRGLSNAEMNSELIGRDSPMSCHSSTADLTTGGHPEPPKPSEPLTYRQVVIGKADQTTKRPSPPPKEILSSPRVSPVRDSSPPKMEETHRSSDEEIVFNPKARRLSVQKAPLNQRPQTPTAPPKVSHVRQASGGRPRSRNGNPRTPRAGPPPVVIDPDSFGRDLPANAQPTAARTFNPYGPGGRIVNDRRGNHRPQNPRPHVQHAFPKTNGVAVTNGSALIAALPVTERLPTPSGLVNIERAPKAQATSPVNPPAILKPSPMINAAPSEAPPSGSSLGLPGSQSVTGAALRPERPRYSPRGSPRRAPVTSDLDVGYILRSGQPREATKGRGKLWVPPS
ncbi:MAG: hypothetical protein LQ352_006515 [Teloschistes flavicans]|nr:MAG: hypothetical protein LQ352_006515 [Teloschistes flavicans]